MNMYLKYILTLLAALLFFQAPTLNQQAANQIFYQKTGEFPRARGPRSLETAFAAGTFWVGLF